jgi:hypothetical protein
MALGCSAGKEKKRERRLNSGVFETGGVEVAGRGGPGGVEVARLSDGDARRGLMVFFAGDGDGGLLVIVLVCEQRKARSRLAATGAR